MMAAFFGELPKTPDILASHMMQKLGVAIVLGKKALRIRNEEMTLRLIIDVLNSYVKAGCGVEED